MNILQNLDPKFPLFVTLNPHTSPSPSKTWQTFSYDHPFFDHAAITAQRQLWQLQGSQNTWYCGSYFGYGFHEDGLQSGLAVAEQLGGLKRPWDVNGESDRIHLAPALKTAA